MAIKSYSTSNYIKTKKGEIDGVVYTVRRLGAGSELDLAAISARVVKLEEKLKILQKSVEEAKTDEDQIKAIADNARVLEQMAEEQTNIEKVYASLFDDGGDQSKSRELVHRLGQDGVKKLLDDIFEEDNG